MITILIKFGVIPGRFDCVERNQMIHTPPLSIVMGIDRLKKINVKLKRYVNLTSFNSHHVVHFIQPS